LPCHYNTFPAIAQDAAKFKTDLEAQTDAVAVVLNPGESYELA
jgi:L-ascorbate metabolism protein UlaG (beta-lactamase superfamily)